MAEAAETTRKDGDGSLDEDAKVSATASREDPEPAAEGRVRSPVTSSTEFGHPHKNGSSPLLHPPKLTNYVTGSTVFGGHSSTGMPPAGMFANPFMPRPPLRTDVVSTGGSDSQSRPECIIAPSRLNPLPTKSSDSECDSGDDKLQGAKKSILAPSKIGFMNNDSSQGSKFQLRPSALKPPEAVPAKGFSSILRPAKLPDPRKEKDVGKELPSLEPVKATGPSSVSAEAGEVSSTSESHKETSDSASGGASSSVETEKFAAELSKNNQLKDSVTTSVITSSQTGFVFGQNLSQRVTGVAEGSESQSGTAEATATSTSSTPPLIFGENLSSRVTFSNGTGLSQSANHEENGDNEAQAAGGRSGQTLEESAREYQAKHDNKVDLKEVQIITGEEDESNVLQANGKLFVFDCDTQTWVERGRGTVRLNDMSPRHPQNSHTFQSRLVMRTQGSLRVILNTKIWPGMNVERASTKAIRITATDTDQAVRVFLIVTNPKDSENLLRAIDWRIQQLKIHEEHDKPTESERHGEKRKADAESESPVMYKQKRFEGACGVLRKEESDSSVQDPETEASCESQASSLTVRSESD